jgi:hypothetical protein
VKKKNAERQARWVQVEALCLCARLEREYGRVDPQIIRSFDYPPAVIEEALRLGVVAGRPSKTLSFGRYLRAVLKFPVWGVTAPARAYCLVLAYMALRHR